MASEPEKASQRGTLDTYWQQFDEATGRQQALLLGQAIVENEGLLRKRLLRRFGTEFGQGEEDLVTLGFQFLDFDFDSETNRQRAIIALIGSMQAAVDRLDESNRNSLAKGQPIGNRGVPASIHQLNLVSQNAWHQFYQCMFQSPMSGGWMWRSVLVDAFENLIAGGEAELFRNLAPGMHGKPLELAYYRRLAVLHVYFAAGKGKGIDANRRKVAEAVGVSFDTLKSWSDALRRDPRGKNEMNCAQLAGRIGRAFRQRNPTEFENYGQYGFFEGTANLVIADRIYFELIENTVELVRSKILQSKLKTTR